MRRRRGHVAAGLVGLLACALLAGCESGQAGYTPKWYVSRADAALPPYEAIREKYNERCQGLDKLRCPANLTIDSPGEKPGQRRTDHVEANLQFVAPSRIALRVDKVAQTLAYLGCDETRYWWLDLGNPARALVGEHARATPSSAAKFGIPVHPLDLIDLLGVLPLPEKGAGAAWNAEGTRWVVTLPARGAGWGVRRIEIDPATAEPTRVEVFDAKGRLAARAELSEFVPVKVRGDVFSKAMMASRYKVEIPATDAKVSVSISQPENPAERMRTAPFDLAKLLDSFGITDVREIDGESGRAGVVR
ncbi:MAG: hypothetical protein GC200_09350 [Tepidisphaera sp.]|nr:hypothetical protein [Tepidisphaera sp.]